MECERFWNNSFRRETLPCRSRPPCFRSYRRPSHWSLREKGTREVAVTVSFDVPRSLHPSDL